MKTSISKESFIEQFELSLSVMAGFVNKNKKEPFYCVQSDFSALLNLAFVHDLLSDEEYQHYQPYEFCQFDNFQSIGQNR